MSMGRLDRAITPPLVVERAEHPAAALAAFVAQELEHWGFGVADPRTTDPDWPVLLVTAGGRKLAISVKERSV